MKPENKIPVLDKISDEMKSVVNFHRDDLPPWPAADDFVAQRQHYIHERRLWNADAPQMHTRECVISTACGPVATRIYAPQPQSQATLYYLHGGGLFSVIWIPMTVLCVYLRITPSAR